MKSWLALLFAICSIPAFAEEFHLRAECSVAKGIRAGAHCVWIRAEEDGWFPALREVALDPARNGGIQGAWVQEILSEEGHKVNCRVQVAKHTESKDEYELKVSIASPLETNSFSFIMPYAHDTIHQSEVNAALPNCARASLIIRGVND